MHRKIDVDRKIVGRLLSISVFESPRLPHDFLIQRTAWRKSFRNSIDGLLLFGRKISRLEAATVAISLQLQYDSSNGI